MTEYAIAIVPLDEEDGGGFVGFAPDLPGCMSDGDNTEEALRNTEQAIEEWLALQARRGVEIPKPGSASKIASDREAQLLEIIQSLEEYCNGIEHENKTLSRKLAQLLAVLKDQPGTPDMSVGMSAISTLNKRSRAH